MKPRDDLKGGVPDLKKINLGLQNQDNSEGKSQEGQTVLLEMGMMMQIEKVWI